MHLIQRGLAEPKGSGATSGWPRCRRIEPKAAIEMATKLRLTNQSRWQVYGRRRRWSEDREAATLPRGIWALPRKA